MNNADITCGSRIRASVRSYLECSKIEGDIDNFVENKGMFKSEFFIYGEKDKINQILLHLDKFFNPENYEEIKVYKPKPKPEKIDKKPKISRIWCYLFHSPNWEESGWNEPYADYTCKLCGTMWWKKYGRIGYQKQWDKKIKGYE